MRKSARPARGDLHFYILEKLSFEAALEFRLVSLLDFSLS